MRQSLTLIPITLQVPSPAREDEPRKEAPLDNFYDPQVGDMLLAPDSDLYSIQIFEIRSKLTIEQEGKLASSQKGKAW